MTSNSIHGDMVRAGSVLHNNCIILKPFATFKRNHSPRSAVLCVMLFSWFEGFFSALLLLCTVRDSGKIATHADEVITIRTSSAGCSNTGWNDIALLIPERKMARNELESERCCRRI